MTGSLQTKGGKYYAVVNTKDLTTGKRKQRWVSTGYTVAGGNKRRAESALRKILTESEQEYEAQSRLKNGNDAFLADFIEEWLDYIKPYIDDVTYYGYNVTAHSHVIPYFRDNPVLLSKLEIEDLQHYFDYKVAHGRLDGKSGGLSPKTLRHHKNILHLTLKEARKRKLVTENLCDLVTMPKVEQVEYSFYNSEQINHLLDCIKNETIYPIIAITAIYGLRRSEVLGLQWDSIDFVGKTLTIKHTVVDSSGGVIEKDKTKNQSSHRVFPLLAKAEEIFMNLKREESANREYFGDSYIESPRIFKTAKGEPYSPSYVSHKFGKLLKKYDLPHIRFHELRHSCASLLLSSGCQLKDVQEWLGHADIKLTGNTYGHLDIGRKRYIAEMLEQQIITS